MCCDTNKYFPWLILEKSKKMIIIWEIVHIGVVRWVPKRLAALVRCMAKCYFKLIYCIFLFKISNCKKRLDHSKIKIKTIDNFHQNLTFSKVKESSAIYHTKIYFPLSFMIYPNENRPFALVTIPFRFQYRFNSRKPNSMVVIDSIRWFHVVLCFCS